MQAVYEDFDIIMNDKRAQIVVAFWRFFNIKHEGKTWFSLPCNKALK